MWVCILVLDGTVQDDKVQAHKDLDDMVLGCKMAPGGMVLASILEPGGARPGCLTFQWDLTALSCFEAVSAVTTVSGETAVERGERGDHRSGVARQPGARPMRTFAG